MSKAIGSSLVLSLLVLACGRFEEQPIGDTIGGSGTGDASVQASGGKAMSVSGSAGTTSSSGGKASGNPGGEECGEDVCDAGSSCFVPADANSDSGICVPLCNPADQTDQTSWGMPCSGAIGGGDGTCRPFLRYVMGGHTGVGVCTNSCDPLAQNCPEGFSCDLTDTPQGSLASWSYACLPVLYPYETGAGCGGSPFGYCQPGATCIFNAPTNATSPTCAEFCDTEASSPCPAMQECAKPDWFPAESSAGVCVVP